MERFEMNLVVGAGEIGTALHKVLRDHRAKAHLRDIAEPEFKDKIDVLHIAIPYSERFVKQVSDYIEQYSPMLTIIYSTLPIGISESIGKHIVHSPIEGRHPKLAESIETMTRWIGAEDPVALEMAVQFWSQYLPKVRTVKSSAFTEFLKLRSTAKYGVNLVWTDYEKKLADLIGLDFSAVKMFDSDYNELYKKLGLDQYQRYILDPPEGVIGGHCIVPNAELLNKQYPNELLKEIIAMKEIKPDEGKTSQEPTQVSQGGREIHKIIVQDIKRPVQKGEE